MIEIRSWLDNSVLFRSETARTIKTALELAVEAEANLTYARLVGARLDGASLVGARLDGARLDGASLVGARLDGASLDAVRDDVYDVLSRRPTEVPGLLAALEAGRIDGSCYEGECACLVGTIANIASCGYREIEGLRPDSTRPAEIWFLPLRRGDTPATSQIAAITAGWVREWLAARPAPIEVQP